MLVYTHIYAHFIVKEQKRQCTVVRSDRGSGQHFLGLWTTVEEHSCLSVQMFWYSPCHSTGLFCQKNKTLERWFFFFTFYMYLKVCCMSCIVKFQIRMLRENLNYYCYTPVSVCVKQCIPCFHLYGCKVRQLDCRDVMENSRKHN